MNIYGAGLAGLLTANMLRHRRPVIHEIQQSLPNNHEALLRFRSNEVGLACGIPFKKVEVSKAIAFEWQLLTNPSILTSNLYSRKVTGEYHNRSITDLHSSSRYVGPPDLVSRMAETCSILYEQNSLQERMDNNQHKQPAISTVPMPILMKIAGWPTIPEFKYKTIWSAWTEITAPTTDLYQTIYYPEDKWPYYRASITGNRFVLEFIEEPNDLADEISITMADFGICPVACTEPVLKKQLYGKLLPIDDAERRRFIYTMTEEFNIYSVGRFATWRQILLDDVVNDVRVVDSLIDNPYNRRFKRSENA